MRVVLLALGLMLLAAPVALAGTIPDPTTGCGPDTACYDCLGTAVAFAYNLSNGGFDPGVVSDGIGCGNHALDCALSSSPTICLLGQFE